MLAIINKLMSKAANFFLWFFINSSSGLISCLPNFPENNKSYKYQICSRLHISYMLRGNNGPLFSFCWSYRSVFWLATRSFPLTPPSRQWSVAGPGPELTSHLQRRHRTGFAPVSHIVFTIIRTPCRQSSTRIIFVAKV